MYTILLRLACARGKSAYAVLVSLHRAVHVYNDYCRDSSLHATPNEHWNTRPVQYVYSLTTENEFMDYYKLIAQSSN